MKVSLTFHATDPDTGHDHKVTVEYNNMSYASMQALQNNIGTSLLGMGNAVVAAAAAPKRKK